MARVEEATPTPISAPSAVAAMANSPPPSIELQKNQAIQRKRTTRAQDKTSPLIDTNGNEFKIPDFTIQDIRTAIPAHCFERSAIRGSIYILRDIFFLGSTFWIFHHFVTPNNVPSIWLRSCLWTLYGYINGLFGTGLWVLGHECNHQAFSKWRALNDTVGYIVHSALLVPYFSWQISHGKHHKSTAHMEKEMVHLPPTRQEFADKIKSTVNELDHLTEDAPLNALLKVLVRQMLGWPVYILTNVTGHDYHERQIEGRGKGKKNGPGGGVHHFNPQSPIFDSKDAKWVWLSNIGVLTALAGLGLLGYMYGWSNIAIWYIMPWFWVNHWLVAITYLQHTGPTLPHYDSQSWTFTRGAAATIDRDMGFIGRHVLHGIAETHVLHHYASTIPFYNAEEASEAIRGVMGNHYQADTEGGFWGFVKALWVVTRRCEWVEACEGAKGEAEHIYFYRGRGRV